jgi:hypothetical protein
MRRISQAGDTGSTTFPAASSRRGCTTCGRFRHTRTLIHAHKHTAAAAAAVRALWQQCVYCVSSTGRGGYRRHSPPWVAWQAGISALALVHAIQRSGRRDHRPILDGWVIACNFNSYGMMSTHGGSYRKSCAMWVCPRAVPRLQRAVHGQRERVRAGNPFNTGY